MKYSKILIFLGIGCVAGLLLVFGFHLQAQNAAKKEIITAKANEMKVPGTPQMEQFRTRQQNWAAPGRQRTSRWGGQQRSDSSEPNNSADFYRAIVDNNIFRPLGWRPPNKEPEYAFIGTRTDQKGTFFEAYFLEQRSNQFHIAKVGDKVGEVVVKEIEEKKIILDKNGETITLRRGNVSFLGGGSRHSSSSRSESSNRNESSSNNKESASKSSDKNAANEKEKAERMRKEMMEKAREMRRRFESASREERARMFREFSGRRGRGR
ncbi:hypothetical protein C6501_17430 [Candidatus Poribacteria bacterium]|nr:MAG: hypothetical protein C6501_17430 [Candidatus Poribacteria bacterium]